MREPFYDSEQRVRWFYIWSFEVATLCILRLFEETEEEGSIVEKQMLEHNLELEKLHQKGNALMTNVRTVCEQRQLEQRQREKTYEKGILNITKILIVKYTQRTLVPNQ